jgi:hypothetical protein
VLSAAVKMAQDHCQSHTFLFDMMGLNNDTNYGTWVLGSDCCIPDEGGQALVQNLVQIKSLTACDLRCFQLPSP